MIIAGPAFSSSGALSHTLRVHPQVGAVREGAHFFDRHFDKGSEWYVATMPTVHQDQIMVEATDSYFSDPDVPRRIKEVRACYVCCCRCWFCCCC